MKLEYQGYDKSGAAVKGQVDAADKAEATEVLRKRGIFATQVSEATGASSSGNGGRGTYTRKAGMGRGRRLDLVVSFTRQLALLVSTGTPLVEAMASLERQAPVGPFRDVVARMRAKVEEGGQLSDAMAEHPMYFDAVCRSLVCAGEQGGKLDVMLERLASLIRQQAKVRKTVQGAMVYPALLICVACVVVTAMLGFVLPRFEGLFKTLDAPLPVTTKFLMSASVALRTYWWMVGGGIAAMIVGFKFWLASSTGKRGWDMFMVRAPQLGAVSRSFATARIARMLGTLLEARVALLDALELTKQSLGNSLYVSLVAAAQEAVTRGENVSSALADPSLINASVCDALRSAEKTGKMATVLIALADYMDQDNELLVKTLTGLLEPLILIVMGIVVGGVAISMFLPLFDLTSAASGGGG